MIEKNNMRLNKNNKQTAITMVITMAIVAALFGGCSRPAQQSDRSATSEFKSTVTTSAPVWKPKQSANKSVAAIAGNKRIQPGVGATTPLPQPTLQPGKLTAYLGSPSKGIIGLYDGNQTDNPADNIFNIKLDYQPTINDKVWLTYRLTGVADNSGVACSINDRLAFGGYLVKKDTATKRQRVQLNALWLQKGVNRIQFGLAENACYGYRISDLALEVEQDRNDMPLAVTTSHTLFNGKAYVHGFVQATGKTTVSIDGKAVAVRDGEFETIISPTDKQQVEVTAELNGRVYTKTLRFGNNVQADAVYALGESPARINKTFEKGKINELKTPDVLLKTDNKGLLATKSISLTALRPIDLPAMDLGMTNVTANNKGFRFLPHGEHFTQTGATVALKYDRTKIPDGYTENDIRSYYFDPNTKHWVALERDTVDKALCMVVSKTTHFTDMINGVIKTPESPETQGFAPTMMNDIKAADPTSKIEMIAPPTANNSGSANLSYSLEMPPARNGMNPNLAIQYNSDGGSGWLGEGWDLNVPSITVDTRFGVPTYDPTRETETYSMGGEILARAFVTGKGTNDNIDEPMFFPDRGVVYLRNKPDKGGDRYQFYPRVEGNFSQIIRIGTNPFDYSWEVTDKNGTKYYYGGAGAELKDPITGNIAEWKLKAMVNIYGDSINYSYRTTIESVYSSLQAHSIYLDKIEAYTLDHATNSQKKHTQVLFVSNSKKSKKTNNARFGFIISNSLLLDSIVVNYDSTGSNGVLNKLRSYSFMYKSEAYKSSALNSDLLDKIIQKDNGGNTIASHSMDYYNNVSDKTYYNSAVTQSPAPLVEQSILGLNQSSVFGNAKTTNKSASLYVGIGGGILPQDLITVNNSIGISGSYSNAKTFGESTLMDINGDGLADKIYYSNSILMFCPQYPIGVFNQSNSSIISGAPAAFMETEKENISLGLAGYSSVTGRIDKDLLAKSKTTAYFSEVNGDGLVDIVYHGNVYFNYISGYNSGIAIPAFTQNSSMTDNPMTNRTIYNTTPAATGILDYSHFSEDSLRSEASPLQDVVRVWEAPYSGQIWIDGNVQLLHPTGNYDTIAYSKADGVRVSIQYNKDEIWFRKINKNENDPIEPFTWYDSETGNYGNGNEWFYVKKGDRIYFRVQSGDSLLSNDYFDNVLWSPVVKYSNYDNNYNLILPNTPDINGYSYTEFRANEGMVSKSGYNVIDSGVPVYIGSNFIKPVTADEVKLSIYASNSASISPTYTGDKQLVYTKIYGATTVANDTLNSVNLSANTYKYFWFILNSNSNNVCWNKVKWEPEIKYNYKTKNDSIVKRIDKAGVNYDIYFDQLNDHATVTNRILQIPNDNGNYFACPVVIYDSYNYKNYKCYQGTDQGSLSNVTVKLIDVDQNTVAFSKNNVTFNFSPYWSTPLFGMGGPDDYKIIPGHKYKVDIYSNSTSELNKQFTYGIVLFKKDDWDFCNQTTFASVAIPTIYNKYNRDKNQEYGLMWRNWGQFEYNAAQGRYRNSIDVDNLKLPSDSDNISLGDMRLITLAPDFKTKRFWQGYSDNIKLRGDTLVPARLLMNNVVDIKAFTSVTGPVRAPRRKISASPESTTNNNTFYNVAVQKPDNPIYHIKAPNIESKEPNIISVSISGSVPVKFLEKIGLSASVNGTYADSKYEKLLDYIDMNGDGYPDYFNKGRILYSNSRGTLTEKYFDSETEHSTSEILSFGASIGGSTKKKTATTDAAQSASEEAASINLSAGVTQTLTTLNISYVDINGDGLPDMINHENNTVSINLGYCFSAPGSLTTFKNNETNFSANAGLGFGVEWGNSFAAGTGIASTYSTKNSKLVDINGDGLVDIVEQGIIADWKNVNLLNNITQKNLKVYLNTGNGFASKIDWQTGAMNESSMSTSRSLNAALTFGIPTPIGLKIVFNPSGQISTTNSCQLTDIRDYNGDGFPDLLSTSPGSNDLQICYSKIGNTNKLQTVSNPLGGKISLAYKRSTPSSDHPCGKWVMDSVIVDDGINDDGKPMKTAFDYNCGKYDRRERQFRGFGEVVSKNLDTDNGDVVFRKITQKFDVSNYYVKNNLLETTVADGNGKVLQETKNIYYCYDVKTFRSVVGGPFVDIFTFSDFNLSDSIVAYSPLKYTKSTMYDDSSNKLVTNQGFYTYNVNRSDLIKNDLYRYGFGELKSFKFSDKGKLDSIGSGEYDYETNIKYRPLYAIDKYVTGLPIDVTVSDINKTYRHIRAYYKHTGYPNHITRISQTVSNTGDSAVTTLKYDKAGNITNKVLPSKMAYTYTYDTRYNMYVTQVKDTFGYVSKLENYNYMYGVPCRTTDENGNVMLTKLDNLGRVTSITGPNEVAAGKGYTMTFGYAPNATTSGGLIIRPGYATTLHYDPANTGNNIMTITIVDGFGRAIQVKKDTYIDGQKKLIVSGRVNYDALGRAVKTYYPTVSTYGSDIPLFIKAPDTTTPAITTYDVLDRPLITTLPDGTRTTMSYALSGGYQKTTVIDMLTNKQESFTNGSGKTVKTNQYLDKDSVLTTLFHYDAISQLDTVTDAMGKQTISAYDMAGRRTQVTHPASGITKFEYDPSGNLKAKQTANMLANNAAKKIQYYYTYNRLDSIVYPDHKENNVKYVYGSATDNTGGNRKGRLVYQEDGSGGQEFKYGKMGELTEVRRTLVIPNQAVATYVTGWTYDCWNRVQTMTYPDGETVNYSYNPGGLLAKLKGTRFSPYSGLLDTCTYVSNITYDKFEQRTSMQYGNGAVTNYTYNPLNRRMDNLNVKVGANYIMNNAYTYDAVSNVKSVTNTGTASNNMGGTMAHNYGYDNLYRLKSANGTFTGANGKTANYTLAMGYDNLHNITGKKQTISQNNVQFTGLLQAGYNLGYQYADNSQQIANIADSSYRVEGAAVITPVVKTQSYGYDANGNMVFVNTGTKTPDGKLQATNSRKLLWDEENRLLSVSDNGFVSNYWYDAAGERTVKESGDNEGVQVNGVLSGARTGTTNFTAYISPYLVLTNGGNYTKHIYMGSQRIVSKLSNSSLFDGENPVDADKAMINDFTKKYNKQTDCLKARYDSLGVNFNGTLYKNMTNPAVDALGGGTTMTPLKYYSHSDHLGSSSLITDASGGLVQHLEYVPFGEVFIDERPSQSSWSTPYKFNAKELDEETGLYYYGARYMDPRTSVWLSVDPLAEKYPNLSSYVYCHNNPVNMIDPDGMTDYTVDNKAYIKRCGDVNNDPDRLIALGDDNKVTKDKDGNITDKITTVNDKKLLPALEANPKVNYKGNYGTTSSEADAFNVYKFVSDNTKAEWGINGYKTKSGDQYLLRTSHDPDAVSTTDGQFNPLQKFIDIHSHWQKTDLPKASGYGGDFAAGDYLVINKKYNQFKSANKKYPEAYPKYFIYHVNSKGLYQYTPDNPSILRRKIRNYVDFYKR